VCQLFSGQTLHPLPPYQGVIAFIPPASSTRSLCLLQTAGLVISALGDTTPSHPPSRFGFCIPPGLWQVQDVKSPVLLELESPGRAQKLSFHTAWELHSFNLQEAGILQSGQLLNKGFSKSDCGTEGSCIFIFRF